MKLAQDNLFYREVQALPGWVLAVITIPGLYILCIACLQLGFGMEIGSKPMSDTGLVVMAILFGLLLPIVFICLRMSLVLTQTHLMISFKPFCKRVIPIQQIRRIHPVQMKPLAEFGGKGIRWNGAKWGVIFEGTNGIELELQDGKPVVISIKDMEQFTAILNKLLEQA
ncbi:DUF6141 family protein [Paenibacillus xylaniclasticus]|uniref:DUF6141 family protein n=1 Tax=Paenibacillus xylaniclasticus TaxID=588083 RepID=UPI000FD895DF|nr:MULTISPECIES: DUF6141 family protein [Paenibacillus]GFN30815.1 hypothetical protein PCURB6_10750 [Paenibacillus curdlanolyticus]